MKTVIIWDELTAEIVFFVVDEDASKFNKVYLNSSSGSQKLQKELTKLIYGKEGKYNLPKLEDFPTKEVLDGAKVIVAGFLP